MPSRQQNVSVMSPPGRHIMTQTQRPEEVLNCEHKHMCNTQSSKDGTEDVTQLDDGEPSMLLYDDGKTEPLPPPTPDSGTPSTARLATCRIILSGQRFGDPQFITMGEYHKMEDKVLNGRPVYQQMGMYPMPSGRVRQHYMYYLGGDVCSWSVGDDIGAVKTRLFTSSQAMTPQEIKGDATWMVIDGTEWTRARRVRVEPWYRVERGMETEAGDEDMLLSARSTYTDSGRSGLDINALLKLNASKLSSLSGIVSDDHDDGKSPDNDESGERRDQSPLDTTRLRGVLSSMEAKEASVALNAVEERGGTPSHALPMGEALDFHGGSTSTLPLMTAH